MTVNCAEKSVFFQGECKKEFFPLYMIYDGGEIASSLEDGGYEIICCSGRDFYGFTGLLNNKEGATELILNISSIGVVETFVGTQGMSL